MPSMDSVIMENSTMTPEKKMALLKLNLADHSHGRSVFSEPTTPMEGKSFGELRSKSVAGRTSMRSTRQASGATRRANSVLSSHRTKMSMDLTSQAESKFMALMEFMSNASREANSLKEYWSKLMIDREAVAKEREEMQSRIDEVTEILETKENQQHSHGRELAERKREVDRLLLELSTALGKEGDYKKRISERDQDLERTRQEVHETRMTVSRIQMDYEKAKSDYEGGILRLRACEGERDHAREDVDKYRSELRVLTREHTERQSKLSDVTSTLEMSQKEVATLMDKIRGWEREREEYLHEKDRLREDLRKSTTRAEDAANELSSMTERSERLQREILKIKEAMSLVENERDDHSSTCERLRHECRNKTASADDAEARYADIVLKYERSKRELTHSEDKLRDVELQITELRHSVDRKHEEHRLVVVDRDQIRDELDDERRKHSDVHRQNTMLQESLTRAESNLSDVRLESQRTLERIRDIERARDEAQEGHGRLTTELTENKEMVVLLQAEMRTVVDTRDHLKEEVEAYRRKYEEVTETITEYNESGGELEMEIETLRTMLTDARQQKERAISARATADRERDDYMSKYDEKCRELERWEESNRASFSHSANGGMRQSSTRITTRSSGARESGMSSSMMDAE